MFFLVVTTNSNNRRLQWKLFPRWAQGLLVEKEQKITLTQHKDLFLSPRTSSVSLYVDILPHKIVLEIFRFYNPTILILLHNILIYGKYQKLSKNQKTNFNDNEKILLDFLVFCFLLEFIVKNLIMVTYLLHYSCKK